LKYLVRTLHLEPGQAFQLTKKGTVGRLLYHLLRNPQEDRQYAISEATHPQHFVVHISQSMAWLEGCRHLTQQGIHDFNRQVEDLLEQEFLIMMDTLASLGIAFEHKKTALQFKERYDLTEDDYSVEALIKCYYRHRKAHRTAQQRRVVIPNCPAPGLALAA
jgi:hypothetical protein